MAIVRTILWSLAKRAATDPRVQKKAGQALRTVDKSMDKAADKVADVAAAKDPVREAGKMLGAFFSARSGPSAEGSPLPVHLVRSRGLEPPRGCPH